MKMIENIYRWFRDNKKRIIMILIGIVLMVSGLKYYQYAEHQKFRAWMEEQYNQAVLLHENKQYNEALDVLHEILEYEDAIPLIEAIETQEENEYLAGIEAIKATDYETAIILLENLTEYKDGDVLLAYSKICSSTSIVENYMQCKEHIPTRYSGLFALEIFDKRVEVLSKYDAYLEKQRKLEAQKARLEEVKFVNSLKDRLPFVGMEEKYLSSTAMGTAYFYGCNRVEGSNGRWKTADIYYYYRGSSIVFTVRIVDGNVYDVTDFRNQPLNRPDVFKSHPYVNNSVKGGKITEDIPKDYGDVYDIELYDDSDDFAYDWADEFDSYDDAFEYWTNHAK